MREHCLPCERITQIQNGTNPYFVAEFETGYIVIGDYQFFQGYTVFLCKEHKTELHELEPNFRIQFLKEMSLVAEAVYRAFKPQKLNYECLGNTDPHLHWHIFPRYEGDPRPQGSVWVIDKAIRQAKKTRPTPEELEKLKGQLLEKLKQVAEDSICQ